MRPTLAKPIGRLFTAKDVGGKRFMKILRQSTMVVTVGDRVTETVWKLGRVPDVQVVDGKENRRTRDPPAAPYARMLRAVNPPATITSEAIEAVRDALGGEKPARVLVDGEEDLLVIPVVIMAPVSAIVLYGQPGEGVVLVSTGSAAKARNIAVLAKMAVGASD